MKKRYIVLLILLIVVIVTVVIFIQFTPYGYCKTIRFRGFTEVEHNIFINNSYSHVTADENGNLITKADIPAIVGEARDRVSAMFGGELLSDPVLIFSDDPNTFRRSGKNRVWTMNLHRVFTYISLSHEFVSVDVVAHEITHAELHHRILDGKSFRRISDFIPIWFDEGLASINDHRRIFDRETWEIRTNNGTTIDIDVTMLTRADFQGTHVDDPFFNSLIIQEFFLFARHEVLSWFDESGTDGLLQLIDGVRAGKDFYELYFGIREMGD